MKKLTQCLLLLLFITVNITATEGQGVSAIGTLTSIVTKVNSDINLPNEYKLEQNHPNPFNPTTIISYSIPVQGNVCIKIYDIQGNEIETLINQNQTAGHYNIFFNANNLSSGLYLYTIQSGNFISTKKMMLIK